MNLYPFTETVASGASPDECVEQIDIGGPAMVRAAAKNHPSVAVVVDPARYGDVLAAVAAGGFTLAERQKLAAAAFRHTATYDIAVASWLGNVVAPDDESGFPAWVGASWDRADVLRYGENPHQRAALYRGWQPGLAHAEQLHGKEMSYNNYVDTDAAWRAAHDHADPCVAIIKHANPCGIAVGADIAVRAPQGARLRPDLGVRRRDRGQPRDRPDDGRAGRRRSSPRSSSRRRSPTTPSRVLTGKKNIRLLRLPHLPAPGAEMRPISGGLLLQAKDRIDAPGDDPTTWTLAAGEPLDAAGLDDLVFAWRAVRAVKSNAILLAHDRATVGVGMGQVNRVDAARLAVTRAGERAAGVGRGVRRVLPVRRRAAGAARGRRAGRRPAGRVGAGRGGRRRRSRGRRPAVPDRHPPLRPLIGGDDRTSRPPEDGCRGRGGGLRPRRLVGCRARGRDVHPLPVRRRLARGSGHPALRVRELRADRGADERLPAPRVGVPVLPVRPREAAGRHLGRLQAHRLAVPRRPAAADDRRPTATGATRRCAAPTSPAWTSPVSGSGRPTSPTPTCASAT